GTHPAGGASGFAARRSPRALRPRRAVTSASLARDGGGRRGARLVPSSRYASRGARLLLRFAQETSRAATGAGIDVGFARSGRRRAAWRPPGPFLSLRLPRRAPPPSLRSGDSARRDRAGD